MERILCVLIGYICGLFQTSYLYGKVHGIDIRNYGSGNAGTTNALRTLGAKAGAITLLGDCNRTSDFWKKPSGDDPAAGNVCGSGNDPRT